MSKLPASTSCTAAVIGLGYVGLPLALELARYQSCCRTGVQLCRRVIGFDIDRRRLEELRQGIDRTMEVCTEDLMAVQGLEFSGDPSQLPHADVFLVTVPTPIDQAQRPDLSLLFEASRIVGEAIGARTKAGATTLPIVIYESTVYPGATENACVPILERVSGLKLNEGFLCGYSPERINPGDNIHKLKTIVKIISGSTPEVTDWVDEFYGSIITAGTYRAPSIRVAEAAKLIENTQRDLNIALVNELAMIFRTLGIDTLDVLEAAGSKWNFLAFRPGLVGGHCISVDPYYLTYIAQQAGFSPQVVLAGRRINERMGEWLVEQLILEMAKRRVLIEGAVVLVLGITFKENCPDIRNSRSLDVIRTLQKYSIQPVVIDPWVTDEEAQVFHNFKVFSDPLSLPIPNGRFVAIIVTVAHREFAAWDLEIWHRLMGENCVVIDIKGLCPRALNPIRI